MDFQLILLHITQAPLLLIALISFLRLRWTRKPKQPLTVSFFHPHAAGRGGGERVLWAAIDGLVDDSRVKKVIVYSLDTDRGKILNERKNTFHISPKKNDCKIEFHKLFFPSLLEPKTYPIATIFGQSIGSVIVLLSGLMTTGPSNWPDVFIDSTGCPFTLPFAKILTGARTHAYVHYPTMSNDMLVKVASRKADFNNSKLIASNRVLLHIKLVYYQLFLFAYRICGWFVDIAVANSKWTASRLKQVWHRDDITVMYPPADIGHKSKKIKIITDEPPREDAIVSLAQFRPEKNHALQLHVFSKILQNRPNTVFYVMGGVRNPQDERLVSELKNLAFDSLKIPQANIQFVVNASRENVNERLKRAKCAIHTMIDEHFGISLLEYLEAKVPVVCHRSGGPEMDILLPEEKFGFLASDEDEFTAKVLHVLTNFESNEIKQKRIAGYNSLSRFLSDNAFGKHFAQTFL